MDSANSFGSNNYVPRQYGNANQTPLYVTDRSGNLQQPPASSHNQYGHHPPPQHPQRQQRKSALA